MTLGNVLIFGDSYSTYKGYIPEGYAIYYGIEENEICGVKNVQMTWWHQLMEETGSRIVQNNSWSGSTVCYTGYNGDCSTTSSFIYRLECLEKEEFHKKNAIDTVLVFGGTNDSWCGAEVGETVDGSVTREERRKVLPAFCHFASELKRVFSESRIVFIVNTELNPTISEGIERVCEMYDAECVLLKDIDKINGHPSAVGMIQIKDQIKEKLS